MPKSNIVRAAALAGCLAATATAAVTPATGWSGPAPAYRPAAGCPALPDALDAPPRPMPGAEAHYRVCTDQGQIFRAALAKAKAEGRLLLVEFGATWCGWCKSFQRQLAGREILGDPATEASLARRLDHVAIAVSTVSGGRRAAVPSGEAVLDGVLARAAGTKVNAIPFLAIVDPAEPARVFTRNLDDLAQVSKGRHDPARVRAMLAAALDHLAGRGPAPSEPGWLMRKLLRWWHE